MLSSETEKNKEIQCNFKTEKMQNFSVQRKVKLKNKLQFLEILCFNKSSMYN